MTRRGLHPLAQAGAEAETERDRGQRQRLQPLTDVQGPVLGEPGEADGVEPAQPHGEVVDQHDREHEVGDGHTAAREQQQGPVGQPAVARSRVEPDRDREQETDEHGATDDAQGHGEPVADLIRDPLVLEEALPEVEAHRSRQPAAVLLEIRIVEAELGADLGDPFRRGVGAAGERDCRIAGNQRDQREHAEGDQQERGDQQNESAND
jgi:hypothetical protein